MATTTREVPKFMWRSNDKKPDTALTYVPKMSPGDVLAYRQAR